MLLDVLGTLPGPLGELQQGFNLQYMIVPGDDELLERDDYPVIDAMNMMTQPSAPVDQESIVLAGFRDCSEEAIRYLLDVEHLPEDDPLVLGLKQHLLARQQQLDVERILQGQSTTDSSSSTSDSSDSVILTRSGSPHHLSVQQSIDSMFVTDSMSPGAHTDSAASSRSYTPMSDIASSPDAGRSSDLAEYHVPDSAAISSSSPNQQPPSVVQGSQPQQQQQQQAADVASVLNLALLAQSNPAIASLTEEILSLLEGEVPVDITDQDSEEEADSAFLDESIE